MTTDKIAAAITRATLADNVSRYDTNIAQGLLEIAYALEKVAKAIDGIDTGSGVVGCGELIAEAIAKHK